jgi:hypothetical protein
MPLLDFFQNPNVSLAAGLLSPTKDENFGQGLLQGIRAGQGTTEANSIDQLRQLRANIGQQGIDDASAFRTGLQGAGLPFDPQNVNQLNAISAFSNANRPVAQKLPTRASLSLLAAQGDKTAQDALDRMGSGALVNLGGIFEAAGARQEGKDLAQAKDTAIVDAGKVRAFEDATNTMLRGLANGAPIGTVASAIMTTDVVRSQFNQAINSKAALEDQIVDLSSGNKEEMRTLIGLAMQGNEIASQKLSLVYMLAGSRETGKLSDTDLKLAFDSIGGDQGSLEGMITRLIATRDGAIDQFNAKQKTNRNRRGESQAFSDFEADRVFTTETITKAPDNVIRSLGGMNKLALDKLLNDDEKKALVARMLGLQ